MSDKTQIGDGSLAFLGLVFATLVGVCVLGAGLGWLGLPAGGVAFAVAVLLVGLCVLRVFLALDGAESRVFSIHVNGLVAGIEWLSAIGLFGITGALFTFGHDGLALILGLAAGFVVSTMAVAPRLRGMAARSLPDYLALRFGGARMRWGALIALAVITLLFVAAQLAACGLVAEMAMGLPRGVGIVAGIAAILVMTMPAGLYGLTAAQTALAALSLLGVGLAALWMLTVKTGIFIPQIAWGGLLRDIQAAHDLLGIESEYGAPFAMLGSVNVVLLALTFALGSAAMPSFIARVSAGETVPQARASLVRGLTVFVIAASVLPALGVLARADLLALFTATEGALPLAELTGLIGQGSKICGAEAGSGEAVRAACASFGVTGGVPFEELSVDPQAILLLLPALAQASPWLLGLLAAAGLSAALLAGGGALMCFAQAVTSRASPLDVVRERRIVLGVTALACALFAFGTGTDILSLGAGAFSVAASALFAPLVFGLWWPRTTRAGAFAGLAGGLLAVALYVLPSVIGDGPPFGIPAISAGALGCALSAWLTFLVSLATDPPSAREQDRIAALHRPSGLLTAGPEAPE